MDAMKSDIKKVVKKDKKVGARAHILVVDDSRSVRYSVTLPLNQAGFNVFEADDGKAALKKLEQLDDYGVKVDMIITDINMPHMDGTEFLKIFRTFDTKTPVLISSVNVNADRNMLKELGANGFAQKPVNADQLVKTVEKLIKER